MSAEGDKAEVDMMDERGSMAGGKLLFVDDEKSILRSLQREFIDSPYEIYLAESGKEGLEVMEKTSIDILISDYKMPGMDGMELLKIVKSLYPSVYRIILSGYIGQQAILRALTSGLATIYISKPWVTEELQDKMKHLFTTLSRDTCSVSPFTPRRSIMPYRNSIKSNTGNRFRGIFRQSGLPTISGKSLCWAILQAGTKLWSLMGMIIHAQISSGARWTWVLKAPLMPRSVRISLIIGGCLRPP